MKTPGIIIDRGDGFFFGFIIDVPRVCAQGKSYKEVEEKIGKYWKSYTERVIHSEVEIKPIPA